MALAGLLIIPALGWACTCASDGLPLCQVLAEPGATLDGGPDSKIFVGRVISSLPTTQEEAWALEAKYFERHPDAKGSPEGRRRFLLDLWGDTLSAESRQRVQAEPLQDIAAFSRLEVIEAFTGEKTGDVIHMFGKLGGGDCSFHFKRGSTYLVMAYRQNGFWTTSICSRSREIKGSDSDVEALRAWRDRKPIPIAIYGVVIDYTARGDRKQGWRILPGMPVRLNGPSSTLDTVTNARGEFGFENLAPGAYRLETLKPGWALEEYVGDSRSRSIGGCRQVLAMAREQQGSVRGRVQAAPGQGLVRALVKLVSIVPQLDAPGKIFDTVGSFQIAHVEPGDYVLAINPENTPQPSNPDRRDPGILYPKWFYPGVPTRDRAEVIHVERGAELVLPGPWTLPAPFVETKIDALFVQSDGKPAAGVRFRVRDRESGHLAVSNTSADPDGRAGFKVLAGRRYRVETLTRDPAHGLSYASAVEFGPELVGTLLVKLVEKDGAPR